MNFRRHRRENLSLNITPMIDVVFLLLIFFMVTTTFHREAELKIELPEAQGKQQRAEKGVDVAIDAAGRYFINQKPLPDSQPGTLKKALQEAAGDEKNLPLVISADQKTPHQAVITVLDVAHQLGLVHIAFATQTASEAED